MKRKDKAAKRKKAKNSAGPKPRNPMARALASGLFKPKVVPAAKDAPYRRRSKHPKPLSEDEDRGED